jgi:hypothetical protein
VKELQPLLRAHGGTSGVPVFAKQQFSMMTLEVTDYVRAHAPNFDTAVLFGIEVRPRDPKCTSRGATSRTHGAKRWSLSGVSIVAQRRPFVCVSCCIARAAC